MNKEHLAALKEARKEPSKGTHFDDIPLRLLKKLRLHLAETGQKKREWLIELLDKL
jgi:hypothetical protein